MDRYIASTTFWYSGLECVNSGQVTLTQWAVANGTRWIWDILYTEQPQTAEELRDRLIKTMNEMDSDCRSTAGTGLSCYASIEHCKASLDALVEVGLAKRVPVDGLKSV